MHGFVSYIAGSAITSGYGLRCLYRLLGVLSCICVTVLFNIPYSFILGVSAFNPVKVSVHISTMSCSLHDIVSSTFLPNDAHLSNLLQLTRRLPMPEPS